MANRKAAAIRWRDQGFTADQVAKIGTAAGWGPVETIKVLKVCFEIGLGEGKTIVDRLQDSDSQKANDYLRYQANLASRFPLDATEADVERMESVTGWNMKLWALIQAGRYPAIESALARFDPLMRTFPAIPIETARALVLSVISEWDIEMELLDDATTEYDFGWVFASQPSAFIKTGAISDMAVDHGPFLVDKFTSVLWATGSSLSIEEYVSNYRSMGNPLLPQPT